MRGYSNSTAVNMKYTERLLLSFFAYAALLGFIGGSFSFLGMPGFGLAKALVGVFICHTLLWPFFRQILGYYALMARFEDEEYLEDIEDDPNDSEFVRQLKDFFRK